VSGRTITVITEDPAETIALGRRIGSVLRGGQVVSLVGPLGSGKTHLVKGVAGGMGVDDEDLVHSPTFVLVHEYPTPGGLLLYHLDAYRLDCAEDLKRIGFEDLVQPDAVLLIEWADKVAAALRGLDPIAITFEHVAETRRRISISNAPHGLVEAVCTD